MKHFDILLEALQTQSQKEDPEENGYLGHGIDLADMDIEQEGRSLYWDIRRLHPDWASEKLALKEIFSLKDDAELLASFETTYCEKQSRHQILIGKCLSKSDKDSWAIKLTLDAYQDDSGKPYHVSGYAIAMEDPEEIIKEKNEILNAPEEEAVRVILKTVSMLTGGDPVKTLALKKAIQNKNPAFLEIWDSEAITRGLDDNTAMTTGNEKRKPGRL